MLGAASSYVFNTASSFVYGPPPPPAASQTTLHPKKKRKTRRRQPPGSHGPKAAEADGEPIAGPSSAPAGPRGRRKGGELGAAYDLVDSINDERDLYKVLGLTKGAKSEDIRRAYIARSRVCHPDKLPTYPPCTPAFQKLSFAYETLSKPSSRRLYDVSGGKDFGAGLDSGRQASPSFGDETLNGVLYSTFVEFMDGDFEMIRVLVNALNEGNPGLNLGEDTIANLEGALRRLRALLLAGQKYVRVVRFELIRLYEIQQTLRGLSYFNIPGRLRLTLQLARVTLSIPMKVDRAMREGPDDDDEEYDGDGENKRRAERRGLLPKGVAGLLGATVAVLEKGEKVALWGSGAGAEPL